MTGVEQIIALCVMAFVLITTAIFLYIEFIVDSDQKEYLDTCKIDSWEGNVANCSIDESVSVMISDHILEYGALCLRAGMIIQELGLDDPGVHACGRWKWIEFKNVADAVAFKLRWL